MLTENRHSPFTALGGALFFNRAIMFASYPLETIKTTQQISSKKLSIYQASTNIFKEHGFKGFFRGGATTTLQGMIKSMISFSSLIYGPDLIRKVNPDISSVAMEPVIGVTVSGLNALTTPLDYLRVRLINDQTTSAKEMIKSGLDWKKINLQFCRQALGWSVKLTTQNIYIKKYKQFFNKEELNALDLFLITKATTLSTIAVTFPLDSAFTHSVVKAPTSPEITRLSFAQRVFRSYRGAGAFYPRALCFNLSTIVSMYYFRTKEEKI